jgi:uncharacterized membrane protein YbhN (UPF0104 family)
VSARRSPRQIAWIAVKWCAGIAFVVFLGIAVAHNWNQVRGALNHMPFTNLLASVILAGLAVACSGFQQHSLLINLGAPPIPPRQFLGAFCISQLGKYVPGAGLAYVAQMELSRSLGVRRAVSVVAMALGTVMTLLLSVCFGGILIGTDAAASIPLWVQISAVLVAVLALVVLLVCPRLVDRLLANLPGRRLRSQFVGVRLTSPGAPVAWSAAAWLAYGLHLAVLLLPYMDDAGGCLRAAVGAFPVAWTVGFLAVIVPAGVGVREMVLAAVLDPLAGPGVALTVAALSRFAIVVAEALLAGCGAVDRWNGPAKRFR